MERLKCPERDGWIERWNIQGEMMHRKAELSRERWLSENVQRDVNGWKGLNIQAEMESLKCPGRDRWMERLKCPERD